MSSSRLPVIALSVALSSCGGAQEPSKSPAAPKGGPTKASIVEDMSPVAAPQDLFAVIRVTQPTKLVDAGAQWAGLPIDWRTLLAKELPGADRMLALDAPVDFAAMIDPASAMEPKVVYAASVGVSSVDAALSFFQERGEVVKRSQRLVRVGSDVTCIAAKSLGAAPARLVCGSDEDAVRVLLPYMTRGLPTETLSASDVHARVLATPFQRRYMAQASLLKTAGVPIVLKEASLDHPKFDGALRDVLYGLADEVLLIARDVDRLSVDLSLAPDQSQVRADVALAFRQAESFAASTAALQAGRVAPAPEAFWRLPIEATSASYSVAGEPERFRKAGEALAALLDGALDYLEVAERSRRPLVDALERVLTTSTGAMAMASVPGPTPPAAGPGKSDPGKAFQAAVEQQLGTHVVAIEGPVEPFDDLLAAATRLLADRKLRERLEKLADLPKGALPEVRRRRPRGGRGLPRGTQVYELDVALEPILGDEAKRSRASAVIVTVPGESRSFVAIGADEKRVYELLGAALPGDEGVLAKREGLARFRSARASSAGFWTLVDLLAGMDSPFEALLSGSFARRKPASALAALLPHRGRTPIPWSVVPSAEGPSVTLSMEVGREVIQDTGAALAAGLASRLGI